MPSHGRLTPKSYEALAEEFFGLVESVVDPLVEFHAILSGLERAFAEKLWDDLFRNRAHT